jgi:hypothetical protein
MKQVIVDTYVNVCRDMIDCLFDQYNSKSKREVVIDKLAYAHNEFFKLEFLELKFTQKLKEF